MFHSVPVQPQTVFFLGLIQARHLFQIFRKHGIQVIIVAG